MDKALAKIPTKQARQIAERIHQLANDHTSLPTIELKGYAPWRRARSGEYRIIFRIEDDALYVGLIGKRNDDEVYRMIERFLG